MKTFFPFGVEKNAAPKRKKLFDSIVSQLTCLMKQTYLKSKQILPNIPMKTQNVE